MTRHTTAQLVAGASLTLLANTPVGAQDADSASADPPPAVVVVPFANYTERVQALRVVMPLVYEHLRAHDVHYLSDSALRPILRRLRARTVGQVGQSVAESLGRETGAARILLGSIDIFEPGENPEVAISLRVFNVRKSQVTRAVSVAAAGEGYAGPFRIGRVTEIDEVARRVVAVAFEDAGHPLAIAPPRSPGDGRRVAVIEFDNSSGYRYAGAAVSSMLLSRLVQSDYDVVEPGAVSEMLIEKERVTRGVVDLAIMRELSTRLGVELVITGTVERFDLPRGAATQANPGIEISARVLDAETGRLLSAFVGDREGTDTETLFQLGRYYSLGRLTEAFLGHVLKMVDQGRKSYLASRN